MKHLIATLTNIFYGLAGWAVYQHNPEAWPVAVLLGVLMLGSGYHHYHLQSWSRWADFVAMYMAITSIALVGFLSGWLTLALSIGIGVGLYLLFKSKVEVILALIGLVMVALLYHSGWQLAPMLEVSAWAALAMGFNYIGDNVHDNHHDVIHGISWHIPTAYALYLAVTYMVAEAIKTVL